MKTVQKMAMSNIIKRFAKLMKFHFLYLRNKSLFWHRFSDEFYTFQQDKMRGTPEEIMKKQSIYLRYIKKVPKKTRNKHNFLECGFGRGEFLELIEKEKLVKIIGVDTNKKYVIEARKKGLNVFKKDLISFLYFTEEKYSGISAFHVIEHLNFTELFDFLTMAYHKLAKGGVLILETPNIENIIVSSTSFYYDHTHIQKVPREFIDKLLDYIGFSTIIFLPINPIKPKPKLKNRVEEFMFGAQDMGIIAYK